MYLKHTKNDSKIIGNQILPFDHSARNFHQLALIFVIETDCCTLKAHKCDPKTMGKAKNLFTNHLFMANLVSFIAKKFQIDKERRLLAEVIVFVRRWSMTFRNIARILSRFSSIEQTVQNCQPTHYPLIIKIKFAINSHTYSTFICTYQNSKMSKQKLIRPEIKHK